MLKSYKTLIFGVLLGGAGALQAVDWIEFVPEGYVGIAMAIVGALVVWLRSMTDSRMAGGS